VLDAIQDEYGDGLEVVVLDVREHALLAMRYGVESVPALVFCDKAGKEAWRQTGPVVTVAGIRAVLAKLGVKPPPRTAGQTGAEN